MKLLETYTLESKESINLYCIESPFTNAKNILIIGGFHGEEPQGCTAIQDYFFNTDKDIKSKNNIFIIPCLNPDGIKFNIRQNRNGVDLNRNFPTKNWEKTEESSEYYGGNAPGSEAETRFLIKVIKKTKPDFILTLHSPYAIVNYDGPAKYEAMKISEFTNYFVQQDIGYPTPGSFGTYCGIERNIPTVTLEYNDNEGIESICAKSSLIFRWLMEEY